MPTTQQQITRPEATAQVGRTQVSLIELTFLPIRHLCLLPAASWSGREVGGDVWSERRGAARVDFLFRR